MQRDFRRRTKRTIATSERPGAGRRRKPRTDRAGRDDVGEDMKLRSSSRDFFGGGGGEGPGLARDLRSREVRSFLRSRIPTQVGFAT